MHPFAINSLSSMIAMGCVRESIKVPLYTGLDWVLDVRIKGSNVIRAAKIALARLAKDNGAELFHRPPPGVERVHKISSAKLAETIERFVPLILPLFSTPPVAFDVSRRWFHIVSTFVTCRGNVGSKNNPVKAMKFEEKVNQSDDQHRCIAP